jgi:small subunit ribosomal protein S17
MADDDETIDSAPDADTGDEAAVTEVAAPEVAAPEAAASETAVAPAAEAPAPARAAAAPAAPAAAGKADADDDGSRPNRRKVREGVVVSNAMESTVVVAVVERVRHPRYGKTVQRTKKLYVHDAGDTARVGDRVRVQETRPLSKLKRWRLTEIVERAR